MARMKNLNTVRPSGNITDKVKQNAHANAHARAQMTQRTDNR